MRRPIIAGNWKMNMLLPEAEALADALVRDSAPSVDIVLAPPFTALSRVCGRVEGSPIEIAGQNIYFEPKGAYTGEISAAMLKDAGCRYVILGHSERRTLFHEDDALINKKIHAALECGLKVIFCVGETLQQREADATRSVVEGQLKNGLQGLSPEAMASLVIAYEPVWAIGTGRTATPEQAQEVHRFTREFVGAAFGEKTAEAIRIQYGGSVTPDNSASLLKQKDIDGALVGSASLKAASFQQIIQSAQ